ncbi:MAG TPA: Crp/Fnr family transcriptional regulator [Bryobacteraceae bacterium]|jgi:CRP/FNR family transcriptional regulator
MKWTGIVSQEVNMTQSPVRTLSGPENPLALLPATIPVQYSKGSVIYSKLRRPSHLNLVIRGKVSVTVTARGRRPIIIGLYGPDDFFGECALMDTEHAPEKAVALEPTEVMCWTRKEIEDLILERPRLGVALTQILARRAVDFGTRLQDCLGEKTAGRVLRCLVHFSERYGVAGDGGTVQLQPITHRLLSEYIGSTREIVTHMMSQFRRDGLLDYSRKGIVLTPRVFQMVEQGNCKGLRTKAVALDAA